MDRYDEEGNDLIEGWIVTFILWSFVWFALALGLILVYEEVK